MKKSFFLILFVFTISFLANAQAPQSIKYQAIARDNSGAILANTNLNVRISIHDATGVGTVIYKETFTVSTNQFGLFNLDIGTGTVLIGTFNTIGWGNGNNKFIQQEVDFGTGYQSMGTSQLLSVPYALYAETSGSGGTAGATGATGSTGTNGINGTTGATGTNGINGATGATGNNGTNGVTGATGNNGTNGATGATGATGNNGTNGITGATGPTGNNGTNGVTGATGASGTTGQNIFEVYGSSQLLVTAATTTFTLIPGLTETVNIPAGATVYVSTCGGMQLQVATASAFSAVDFGIFVDGVAPATGGQQLVTVQNSTALGNNLGFWSFNRTFTLAAGNHTFEVGVESYNAGSASLGVSSGAAPQIQGVLTVMIIKQ